MDNVKAAAENSETTLIEVKRIPTCRQKVVGLHRQAFIGLGLPACNAYKVHIISAVSHYGMWLQEQKIGDHRRPVGF